MTRLHLYRPEGEERLQFLGILRAEPENLDDAGQALVTAQELREGDILRMGDFFLQLIAVEPIKWKYLSPVTAPFLRGLREHPEDQDLLLYN